MSRQSILSFKYNMAWGFIPVLLSMLLSEVAPLGTAIYTGALLGVALSAYTFLQKGEHLPQILLYGNTAMLVLLSATHLLYAESCLPQWYPFTLEAGTLLLILAFYLNRRALVAHYTSAARGSNRSPAASIEATVVSPASCSCSEPSICWFFSSRGHLFVESRTSSSTTWRHQWYSCSASCSTSWASATSTA